MFAWNSWNNIFSSSSDKVQEQKAEIHGERAEQLYYDSKQHAKDAASLAGEAAREKVHEYGEAAQGVAGTVKEKAEGAVGWTKEKAHEAAEWTKDKALHARGAASDILTNMRRRLTGIKATDQAGSSPVQVRVLPGEYLILLDAPGIPASSLNVHLSSSQLLIYGEHEECHTHAHRRTCWERAVEEIIELPEDANVEDVEAWLHLQVLVVRVPRRELPADRKVKVAQKSTIDKILEKVGLDSEN